MRNPAKAILVAILIAIPASFILGLLLTITPEPLKLLALGEGLEALGSQGGVAALLISVVVIAIAAFLAVVFTGQPAATSNNSTATRAPSRANSNAGQFDEENDFDDNTPEGVEEGSVKWFNVKKGFGFIVRENGDEIFVHFRAIRGHGRRVLRQGQLVRFDVVDADKGLQADNVSILSD